MEIGKCKTQVDKFNRFTGSRLTGHQVDRSPGLQVGENAGWQVTVQYATLEDSAKL